MDSYDRTSSVGHNMPAYILTAPILPGQSEAWRRFIQEMLGTHYPDYRISRRGLGIARERIWLTRGAQGEVMVLWIEGRRLAQSLAQLATSYLPFDRWFRAQWLQHHGTDLSRFETIPFQTLVSEWEISLSGSGVEEVQFRF